MVTENKTVIIIGYNFRSVFYINWSKQPKLLVLKICVVNI